MGFERISIESKQPGTPRLFSFSRFGLLLAGSLILACPQHSDAQTSGGAAQDTLQQDLSIGLTGARGSDQAMSTCSVEELLPAYANDQLGATIQALQEIQASIQCVSDPDTLNIKVNTGAGHDLIRVACQGWTEQEEADVLFAVTPNVPRCVRLASEVRAYRRSAETAGSDAPDDVTGLMYLQGGQILFSSEFFPASSRSKPYHFQNDAERERFAREAEERVDFKKAEQYCQWNLDQGARLDLGKDRPVPNPEFAKAVSRSRSLFHEYLHGVMDAQGDSVVRQFADAGATANLTKTWDQLAREGVITSAEAEQMQRKYGGEVQEVSSLKVKVEKTEMRTDKNRLLRMTTIVLRQVSRQQRVSTPDTARNVLDAKIGLLKHEMIVAVKRGDLQGWRDARERYCGAVNERSDLLAKIGFGRRWDGDAHAADDTEEDLVIAATMAVYDPSRFEKEYSRAQKQIVRDWWARTFECSLEQARDFVRRTT